MTDTLPLATTINGTELKPLLTHLSSYTPIPLTHADTVEDDDGQISCLCRWNEDDGYTVACDICNKWQHIRCYYPQYDENRLPDDLQHFCVDCKPRHIDVAAARARQVNARTHRDPLNGKRPVSKNKKKLKDHGVVGWPDKRHDRKSASPREGPPAKRPKTQHRPANTNRKRSASTLHQRSASASPEFAGQTYSPEFIEAYRNDHYKVPASNCFSNLEIGDKLVSWLSHSEEVYKITEGKGSHEIFQRFDGDMNVINPPDTIDLHNSYDHRVKLADGSSVSWKIATLKEPQAKHACLGELRGEIGFKEDYKAEPTNRWQTLKHPEPFVFFHPHLPVYVDARNEGSIFRYIRRSCDPNAELKVIITEQSEYHFCFMALRDIDAGEEVAIAWDCARTIADMLSGPGKNGDAMDTVYQWVSLVLSNCGPCACKRSDCLMAHFDKRFSNEADRPVQPSKQRRKKDTQHISPLNTHAVNSRSGSEARRFDPEDDRDSRSVSGSGKGYDSRDITPNTHYSANGQEVSERERKKLAKEEEMFRRQEEQANGKQSKKKRTSGGNNLNIPASATAKSPALPRRMDSSNGRSVKPGRRPKSAKQPFIDRTESAYADAGVQCEMDDHETLRHHRQTLVLTRRRHAPLHQRLLDRCAQVNALWHAQQVDRRASIHKVDKNADATMTQFMDAQKEANADASQPPPTSEMSSDPVEPRPMSPTNTSSMKIDMPPPLNPFSSQGWSAGTPNSIAGPIVQSPATSGPYALLSPSVQTVVGPSTPMKKKLSLSDYTRRKAKETEVKPDHEGSPGSITEALATGDAALLPSIVEDTPMEDAPA